MAIGTDADIANGCFEKGTLGVRLLAERSATSDELLDIVDKPKAPPCVRLTMLLGVGEPRGGVGVWNRSLLSERAVNETGVEGCGLVEPSEAFSSRVSDVSDAHLWIA